MHGSIISIKWKLTWKAKAIDNLRKEGKPSDTGPIDDYAVPRDFSTENGP